MSKEIETAIAYFEAENIEKSLVIVNQILEYDADNVDALLLKAKISYKFQEWGDTLNYLNRALEVDSENSVALNLKKIVLSIINYWNKDSLNP